MKQLFFAGLLTFLLVPHFSYAANDVTPHAVVHHREKQHHAKHSKTSTQPVDINQANAVELATLKGIGPKKAQAIVAFRTAHGPFKSVNDLAHVKGIGAKSVSRLESKNPGRIVINMGAKIE